jgi:uncharacterized membrane protein
MFQKLVATLILIFSIVMFVTLLCSTNVQKNASDWGVLALILFILLKNDNG